MQHQILNLKILNFVGFFLICSKQIFKIDMLIYFYQKSQFLGI